MLVFRQCIELLYKYGYGSLNKNTHMDHFPPACSVCFVHVLITLYSQKGYNCKHTHWRIEADNAIITPFLGA